MIAPSEQVAGRAGTGQISLGEVERNAQDYAKARQHLAFELNTLRQELEDAKKRRINRIKQAAAEAAEAEARLRSVIEAGADLFRKPKTLTMHGIKVGYRTSSGRIVFADGETVIKLIRKHLSDRVDLLVRTVEEVNKNGLKTLTAVELAKIGCSVEGAGEQVVVDDAGDEVDKLVGKLITEMVGTILEEEREQN